MAIEEPAFKIVSESENYEIRYYQERLIVQTEYESQNGAFRKLFKYISGSNKSSEKISKDTGLPVTIADDPLSCVAVGTGKALENEELFSTMLTEY